MTKIEPFPFDNKREFPASSFFHNNNHTDSAFSSIIKHTNNEIALFEQSKRETEEDLMIKINSKLTSGNVGLTELNVVSSGIQRVFTSMYNNLFGKGNTRGIIPKEILDSSELILTNTSPGSFNMHLKLKNENPIINSHDYRSINYLSELMDNIDTKRDYTDIVDDFGIRTFNVLKGWFEDLEKEEIEFDFSDIKKNKKVSLSKEKIKNVNQSLKNIKTKEKSESVEIHGILLAADSTKLSFIIKSGDKEIKGKTTAELFREELTINKKYNFKLTKKLIINTSTRQEKESFYLHEIKQ